MVEGLYRVSHALGKAVDIVDVTHNSQAVANLQGKIRAGNKVKTRTMNTGDIELVAHAQSQRTEFASR